MCGLTRLLGIESSRHRILASVWFGDACRYHQETPVGVGDSRTGRRQHVGVQGRCDLGH